MKNIASCFITKWKSMTMYELRHLLKELYVREPFLHNCLLQILRKERHEPSGQILGSGHRVSLVFIRKITAHSTISFMLMNLDMLLSG